MPLTLPPGYIPTFVPVSDEEVLRAFNGTYVDYRIDVLTAEEQLIGTLDGVQPGGTLEWSAAASIKGSGSITVTDVGQPIDWLNVRLRPVLIIEGFSEPEWPLAVWLAAAPTETWTDLGRTWEIELLDKLSILDQDIYTDPTTGRPTSYVAKKGARVTALVADLIAGAGESSQAIAAEETTLTSNIVWDIGTTRLKIINDLLDAAGFFSLYVDHFGQYTVTKYQAPKDRPTLYEALAPFQRERGVMHPDFSRDDDIYAIPNRVVAISSGDDETAALVATATNTDPNSRFSYVNRGNRWITRVETEVEATSQATLQTYADRLMVTSTSKASKFSMQHLVLPDLTFNSVVRVLNDVAGIDLRCTVSNTTIPLDPTALASTTLSEVTGNETGEEIEE